MTSDDQTKRCVNCGGELTGHQRSYCSTECQREVARQQRLADHFAITPDEYDAILREQGGGCGICGRPPTPGKRHAVDHDHTTGYVRGLLCFMCNKRVLGARSADVLVKTAEYVTNPPARRVIGDRVAPGRPRKKRKRATTRRNSSPGRSTQQSATGAAAGRRTPSR